MGASTCRSAPLPTSSRAGAACAEVESRGVAFVLQVPYEAASPVGVELDGMGTVAAALMVKDVALDEAPDDGNGKSPERGGEGHVML